jgi:hypothetical protein
MAAKERDARRVEAAQAAEAHLDVEDTTCKQPLAQCFEIVDNLPSDKQPPNPTRVTTRNKHVLSTADGLRRSDTLADCEIYALAANQHRAKARRAISARVQRDCKSENQKRVKSKKMNAEGAEKHTNQRDAITQFNLGCVSLNSRVLITSKRPLAADQGQAVHSPTWNSCMQMAET